MGSYRHIPNYKHKPDFTWWPHQVQADRQQQNSQHKEYDRITTYAVSKLQKNRLSSPTWYRHGLRPQQPQMRQICLEKQHWAIMIRKPILAMKPLNTAMESNLTTPFLLECAWYAVYKFLIYLTLTHPDLKIIMNIHLTKRYLL